MNIFVLEDDFHQQGRMENIINEFLEEKDIKPNHFEIYGKPDQLLADIEEKGRHQIFFLDIEIKTETKKGLEVGQKIRQLDPNAYIVFVTTHTEFMPLTFRYRVGAMNFIDKELSDSAFKNEVRDSLLDVLKCLNKSVSDDSFYFKTRFTQLQMPFKDIFYIETSSRPHRVILYTATERMEFTASIKEIVKQNKQLLHCHRSYAINPQNVTHIDNRERIIYFPKGRHCFFSRNKIGLVNKAVENLH